VRPRRTPRGPVVIWNLVRRCNLTCKHCYSGSTNVDFPGELATGEVYRVMDDLKAFGVPVLILSGGEPLMRRDIFEVSRRAKDLGFYVGLSTNGTLIDAPTAGRIAETGYDYVGISIDGIGATHDRFRGEPGSFEAAMGGVRRCREAGIKVGLRFTMTQDNADELPQMLELMEAEGVDKFYFSHLNYGGRGNTNRGDDAWHGLTRWAMDLLFEAAYEAAVAGRPKEFVTGNNDASTCCCGRASDSPAWRSTCGRSWRSGAAILPASTSPTSTTWATSTRTPSGGTIPSATSAAGRSRRSGPTSPTRSWPA
jgi:MoaA/NifB/PqqE/SkfB family radical SAM enzyme